MVLVSADKSLGLRAQFLRDGLAADLDFAFVLACGGSAAAQPRDPSGDFRGAADVGVEVREHFAVAGIST